MRELGGRSDYISGGEARLRNKRLWSALGAYALLALIAHFTLGELFRAVVWIFVAGLAVMTIARAKYEKQETEDRRQE